MSLESVQIDHVRVRILPDGRMTRSDAAKYLGVAVKTVAMWDLEDPIRLGGIKVGGRRFYYKDRLDAVIRGEVVRDGLCPNSRKPEAANPTATDDVAAE